MRIWLDTEFMEDGNTIEDLSLGAVAEDDREFYAENAEADWSHANDWVRENVLPHLHANADGTGPDLTHPDVMTRAEMAEQFHAWVLFGDATPEFWAYYGDYDWVVLCQLYGRMVDLPAGWPMFCMDVKQLAVSVGNPPLPPKAEVEHNALHDARWTRTAWEHVAIRDDDGVVRIPARQFKEEGFLQEANRQFFHLHGLAMEVVKFDDDHYVYGGVWDYRADPEGMEFGPDMLSREKAEVVAGERERHREAREAMFGDIIQPLP